MLIGLSDAPGDRVALRESGDDGAPGDVEILPAESLATAVVERERRHPRWVWSDTAHWYPRLLSQGVRVDRCTDLRLSHAILHASALTSGSVLARAGPGEWDHAVIELGSPPPELALFDIADGRSAVDDRAIADELALQQDAVASSEDPARIRLLLAAESAGALVAAEMRHAGLPWRADVHDRLLTELAGPRTPPGVRPSRLAALVEQIRAALDDADLNPDSAPDLVRSLRRAGLVVTSTRSHELERLDHPVVAPLLAYKKLSRLLAANGWAWMDAWVADGRFRPEYVPGGVVSGRWATRGGGALQLPKQVRSAVVADDGWKLVVADAAQLEPRVLAGLAQDAAMAAAGRGRDLYAGIVDSGVVAERHQAKVAMLGAMYGATTGDSGRLVPRLAGAFPRALALVEAAARAGERGEIVTSHLGRSSPPPPESWRQVQARAYGASAGAADERRARAQARDWGRFTRNFVVQASAAEWSLCWMAELRKRLTAYIPAGKDFTTGPHLVYFLHDEVIVHTPAEFAEAVVDAVTDSAVTAGRLLFGDFPVDFPVTAVAVDSYAEAK